jgi:hypothetical protein
MGDLMNWNKAKIDRLVSAIAELVRSAIDLFVDDQPQDAPIGTYPSDESKPTRETLLPSKDDEIFIKEEVKCPVVVDEPRKEEWHDGEHPV